MFNFDIYSSKNFLAQKLEKIFLMFGFLKNIFFIFSVLTLFLLPKFFLISFFLLYISWYFETFFNLKIKNPKPIASLDEVLSQPEAFNLADFLDYFAFKAVNLAIKEAKKYKVSNIDSSFLLFSLLGFSRLNFILYRALFPVEELKKILIEHFKGLPKGGEKIVFEQDFQNVIFGALSLAKERGKSKVGLLEIFLALAKENPIFKRILIQTDLKISDIENLCWLLEHFEKEIVSRKKFWEWENLSRISSLGKEWSAGYTVLLDRFSYDLEDLIRKEGFKEIFAHKKEIEEAERILSGIEQNDVLIVGEPGSGRKSIIEGLARKCILGQSTPVLNYRRIVYLDLPKLVASTKTIEEAEEYLDRIFTEVANAGNVILVIDNLHNFIGLQTELTRRAAALEISGILGHYLPLPQFQLIGITTFEGLHKNIEQKPEILTFFEKIEVTSVSPQETLLIIVDRALRLERKYKVFVSFQALRDIISLTDKYQASLPFPEKAIELLDDVILHVCRKKERIVLPKHVAFVLSQKVEIPIGELEEKEKEKLLNLEKLLHERIIDQDEAIFELSNALRRARSEIKVRKGPIGSFLFLGPTGVGKTETAKALADIYFGGEERMIRLDMSEFQKIDDIPRLIGSPGEEGLLTTPVRENPFSLLLLDEFEKAHPNIFNLFLQVFDEGHITDGQGRRVDFKNTIIIATSNAGYQMIFKAVKEGKDFAKLKEELINFFVEQGIFRPELINRFDAVVVYHPLSKENLLAISELMLKKIQKQLKEKEIDFQITEALKEKIVELSYTPEFGARQMQRVIQDTVGNNLAKAILEEKIKRGDVIEIDPSNFEVKVISRNLGGV